MHIPFLDLKAQYQSIKEEIQSALAEVIAQTAFAGGPFVARFEQAFAEFCGCREAVGVGSGTEALWMALLALGVGPGDEVITVPNTFIATAEAVSFCGAKPVFVDIDERTYNLDPNKLEDFLKKQDKGTKVKETGESWRPVSRSSGAGRLKAIVPVHLYGQPADMDPILELAEKYGLAVIEDACQAHGAEYKGRRAGSMGAAGCFSFYPGKNLGAYGEAGAVTSNNPELAGWIRTFRDHGQPKRYYHDRVGWNGRMDGFQGAVLGVKLPHLEGWNNQRREKADLYRRYLGEMEEILLPAEAEYARHIYHIYPIRVKNRDEVIQALTEKGVNCGIHYPLPIHLQKAYAFLGHKAGDFPTAETVASELLSLPMYPELTEEQIVYVAECLKEAVVP
jgi:dTDP-4-amino-4,6-dideoxygalactose transaminase